MFGANVVSHANSSRGVQDKKLRNKKQRSKATKKQRSEEAKDQSNKKMEESRKPVLAWEREARCMEERCACMRKYVGGVFGASESRDNVQASK